MSDTSNFENTDATGEVEDGTATEAGETSDEANLPKHEDNAQADVIQTDNAG